MIPSLDLERRPRKSGIHEKLIMDIGDWETRSMFDRCTITDTDAMRRAIETVTAPRNRMPPNSPRQPPDRQGRKSDHSVRSIVLGEFYGAGRGGRTPMTARVGGF